MTIQELLQLTIKNNASDLHLLPNIPPAYRIDGSLFYATSFPKLTPQDIEGMAYSLINPQQKELLLTNKELDFSVGLGETEQETGRFRSHFYFQKQYLCAEFRYLPLEIKTIEELGLPKIVHSFTSLTQGFILISGPTGHGKSTTLAAILNEINKTRAAHILTIEDPIEYVYPMGKSIISQREIGVDTHSWGRALRAALREDPDVVLVGEMRDPEAIAAAITIAETGHLVFSTLHTNSASQSIDRIVDSFPANQQAQIRIQLASTLKSIVSQRLLPKIGGGRVLATEVLISNSAIASNIRDAKTHLINSIMQTSQEEGMMTLESSLAQLVVSGAITLEIAKNYALHQDELIRLVG